MRVLGSAAVLAALAAFALWRFEVTTDITHFLPSADDQVLAELSRAIADSGLSRTMVLSVGAADTEAAADAARALSDLLTAHPEVAWVERGPAETLGEAFYDLYFPRRFHFFSEEPAGEVAARLSDAALTEAAQELKRQLALPTAPLVKRLAPGDPLLAFPALLRRLEAAGEGGLRIERGQFFSTDGRHAILFLGTAHGAFDATAQAPLLAAIDEGFAALRAAAPEAGLSLELSGVNRYAVQAETSIRADVTRIGVVSVLGIVAFFLAMFGSLRLLFVALLPILAGLLAAVAVGLAVFGRLHGLTLAFGASLIGVCIDYPIHFFNHYTLAPAPGGPDATLRRVWMGLALGALTTVAGFAGLAWTSFPGIREVAVFAGTGVLAALLTTRVLLPPLMPAVPASTRLQRWAAARLARLLDGMARHRRALVALPVAAVALAAAGLPSVTWEDDVQALTRLDPELKAEDDRVRARVGSMEAGRVLVARGVDEASALAANDAVAARLDDAVAAGELGGHRSLHTLLWSPQRQRDSHEAVASSPNLAARMVSALEAEEFAPAAFAPFAEALASPPPAPLTFDDLARSPLQRLVRPFRVETPSGPAFLTFLREVNDPVALAGRFDDLEGVTYLDQRAFVNQAYGAHRSRSLELVLVGLLAVLALVAVRYRRPSLSIAAFLPALLAAGVTVAVLSLAGYGLNLLHVVALLLVMSMGVDYGVFLAEAADHPEGLPATVLSLVIACASTVLAFGLLAMSDNPALRAIGLTTGVGVLTSLILAPTTLVLTGATE